MESNNYDNTDDSAATGSACTRVQSIHYEQQLAEATTTVKLLSSQEDSERHVVTKRFMQCSELINSACGNNVNHVACSSIIEDCQDNRCALEDELCSLREDSHDCKMDHLTITAFSHCEHPPLTECSLDTIQTSPSIHRATTVEYIPFETS
eukprot:Tbor_TRINITY_DN2326_c0_g2::TRINITY_DN2326_c0_g2_i1::g.126::m.126